jgi:hypothetical protein
MDDASAKANAQMDALLERLVKSEQRRKCGKRRT